MFRVDSSHEIGSGHVVRCLTLAGELRERMFDVSFVCRDFPGNISDQVRRSGFHVHLLEYDGANLKSSSRESSHMQWLKARGEMDAVETVDFLKTSGGTDLLVVDNYSLDVRWERAIKPYAGKILVIDDLADRAHACDFLLDQNLKNGKTSRYEPLVKKGCKILEGPRYALLRSEFGELRKTIRPRTGEIKRVLIFFGGMDQPNLTGRVLEAINNLHGHEILFDVVVGETNPHRKRIKDICEGSDHLVYHCQVPYMAELMAGADLFIGATGISTWERCCLGLPGVVVTFARNQVEVAEILARKGVVLYLGDETNLKPSLVKETLEFLINRKDLVREMSRKALKITDGRGVKRVVECLTGCTQAVKKGESLIEHE